jgi:hypothetical protein
MNEKKLDQREFIKWVFKNTKTRWLLFVVAFVGFWISQPASLGSLLAAIWNGVFLVGGFLFFAHLTVQSFIDDLSVTPQIPINFEKKSGSQIDTTLAMLVIAIIALIINAANFIFTHFIDSATSPLH